MDTQLLNELINVLDNESNIYSDILNISKDKTGIIVAGKVSELEKVVKLEQALIFKISGLEGRREQLVEKLSSGLGLKLSDITISELVRYIGGEQAAKLKTCQEKMNKVILELKDTNELNSKLIKNSLDFINFSVNLLTSVDSADNSYGYNGQTQDTKKRNLFDVKR